MSGLFCRDQEEGTQPVTVGVLHAGHRSREESRLSRTATPRGRRRRFLGASSAPTPLGSEHVQTLTPPTPPQVEE